MNDLFRETRPAAEEERLDLDIEGWEGPLDLLLDLARRQKVDLTRISILELTEQYLAFIADARRLRLELAADYLVMAAWLAYLKSALLLPKSDTDEEAEGADMALRLHLRLQRLEAMRTAGAALLERDRVGEQVFVRGAPEGLQQGSRRYDCSLYDLMRAYGYLAGRGRAVSYSIRRRPVFSLEEAIRWLERTIGGAVDWDRLSAHLPRTGDPVFRRSVTASGFVAALELARQGRLVLRQRAYDAPLEIRAAGE
ncbi:segregation and condensation protein A [Pacificimonas flava]|uniref:Segregation and condensation protein A n=1 Tax=Pacificimonas flava TaxID=1234595 RepID=M2U4Q8_9SPHN|nr:ScpA family protein [Pacificimonas flava]EMD83017.1 Segregation and condensation protein A [Pacificimonas flava]MBB5280175.1 segregation and condensation protein A [Pacificimonas flava]